VPEGDTIHRTATALRAALLEKVMTGFDAPRLSGHRPTIGAVIDVRSSRARPAVNAGTVTAITGSAHSIVRPDAAC